jgi:hypothetical protein
MEHIPDELSPGGVGVKTQVGGHQPGPMLAKPIQQPDQLAQRPRHRAETPDEQNLSLS